jgi:hypothetical protein
MSLLWDPQKGREPMASSCRDNSRCFRNLQKDRLRIQKGPPNVESLLPPELVVRERVLGLNLRTWKVKDWIRPLECPQGLMNALLGRVWTRLRVVFGDTI